LERKKLLGRPGKEEIAWKAWKGRDCMEGVLERVWLVVE
jgi:hypothetical protein